MSDSLTSIGAETFSTPTRIKDNDWYQENIFSLNRQRVVSGSSGSHYAAILREIKLSAIDDLLHAELRVNGTGWFKLTLIAKDGVNTLVFSNNQKLQLPIGLAYCTEFTIAIMTRKSVPSIEVSYDVPVYDNIFKNTFLNRPVDYNIDGKIVRFSAGCMAIIQDQDETDDCLVICSIM